MIIKVIIRITCIISFAYSFPDERKDRMFSLFNVVKFKNSDCTAASSTAASPLTGICHTSEECSDLGGTSDGNCAASFGVCCTIKVNTCPGTVSQNGSYIENPAFPVAYAATANCVFTINKCSSDICQIRLDFTSLVQAQPTTTTGNCGTDTLTIAPGGGAGTQPGTVAPPVLCGTNTGHHVYLDAGITTAAATVTFVQPTAGTSTWRIKVSQIECYSANRAPSGCLQYFSGSNKHTVTSFNYDGLACTATGCFLETQDYRVCFRDEAGMCGVAYSETPVTTGDAFLLTNAATTALITFANCPNGFLQFGTLVPDTPATQDIYCGSNLAITAAAIPATLTTLRGAPTNFRVTALAAQQNLLPGFSLDATQVPC